MGDQLTLKKRGEDTMREKLEDAYLAWEMNVVDQIGSVYCKRKNHFVENFVEDEEGDSNMVAVVVLIVIVIIVGGVFQEQLKGAVEQVFGKLSSFIDTAP